MNTSNHDRLQALLDKRETLVRQQQSLQGRLTAAEEALEKVKQKCLEKNIPPERLGEALEKLQTQYDEAVSKLETDLNTASEQLQKYT